MLPSAHPDTPTRALRTQDNRLAQFLRTQRFTFESQPRKVSLSLLRGKGPKGAVVAYGGEAGGGGGGHPRGEEMREIVRDHHAGVGRERLEQPPPPPLGPPDGRGMADARAGGGGRVVRP